MAYTTSNSKRIKEGDEEKKVRIYVPNDKGTITNVEIRVIVQALTQAMKAHVNKGIVSLANNVNSDALRERVFED